MADGLSQCFLLRVSVKVAKFVEVSKVIQTR